MDDGQPRIQAAHWVITLGRVYAFVLGLMAAWALVAMLFAGSPVVVVLALLATGAAAAWTALVQAFAAHRRGAWWLLVALSSAGLSWRLLGWLVGPPPTVPDVLGAAAAVVLLGLLLHDDSREWVSVDRAPRPSGQPDGWGH